MHSKLKAFDPTARKKKKKKKVDVARQRLSQINGHTRIGPWINLPSQTLTKVDRQWDISILDALGQLSLIWNNQKFP